MQIKGFEETSKDTQTPKVAEVSEKPLKNEKNKSGRVDINVLKSKLQESESKEFKKNLFILSSLVIGLGVLGIYLSL